MPVLLGKSGVRSSHVSSSLGRRIQSAHLLCNFHKREKKKRRKGLTTQPLSPRPPSPFISSHMSLAHLVINMEEIRGLRDASDFSLFLQFPFHLSFYSSTLFPPVPSLTQRIVHCHYSPPSLRFTLHALEIPKTSHSLLIEQHPSFLPPHCSKYYYI